MKRIQKTILRFLLLTLMSFSSLVYATTETGLVWLNDQISSDNNYSTNTRIATELQSLSEMQTTLKVNGQILPSELILQINADDYNGTESLSRKIVANIQTSKAPTLYVDQLLKHQTQLMSFGEDKGYHGSILDTAFALNALSTAGVSGQNMNYAMTYLLDNQEADGSWRDGQNESSVYLTSLVLRTLWKFHLTYNIKANIDKAKNYLLLQKSGATWGEDYLTAHVLLSLLPTLSDRTKVESAIDSLRIAQKSNGSWKDDIYITSLALQALELSERPISNSYLANVSGKIVDSDNQIGLSGASIALAGQSVESGTDGSFQIFGIDAGTYTIKVEKPEYGTLSGELTLNVGQNFEIGTVNLIKNALGINTGTIRGTIVSSDGTTLSNVAITAGKLSTLSQADGTFQIANVPVGETTIVASLNGYFSSTSKASVEAGGTILFSPTMSLDSSNQSTLPAKLIGTVVDSITKAPLIGVNVYIDNGLNTVSDVDGKFSFDELGTGSYSVNFTKAGYAGLGGIIDLEGGKTSDFGILELSAGTVTSPTGKVSGVIVDKQSQEALSGILVSVGKLTAVTDGSGRYQINGIEPGNITVITEASEYYPASANAELLAGQSVLFSPELQLIPKAAIFGSVTDADTATAISGAEVKLIGTTNLTETTDVNGEYLITPLNEGDLSIQISKTGYDTLTISTNVFAGNQIAFSPTLHAMGTTPENANTSSLVAQVLNSATNEILADVSITVNEEGKATRNLKTDNDGKFLVEGIQTAEVSLSVDMEGFKTVSFILPIDPLKNMDIGQIRLRPSEIEKIQPDLIVSEVNASNIVTDPSSLIASGILDVKAKNIGSMNSTQDIDIVAFNDANNNGYYDESIDVFLGQTQLLEGLKLEQNSTSMQIEISGQLPFRDAPITVWIDSSKSTLELVETNNYYISSQSCKIETIEIGSLDPVIKWHWDGSDSLSPHSKQVMSSPMVAQLNDDNDDGKINNDDIADIVFSTFAGASYNSTGLLRAVSGADGQDIWNVAPRSSPFHSPAIGDIDHDGLVEIVVGLNSYGGLLVYENDGTLKWEIPVSGKGSPALADLNHDGNVEIIYARSVYDADGNVLWTGIKEETPIVADIDMDGMLDIVADGNLYDHEGNIKWSFGAYTRSSAIGNFDDDEYPEIVSITYPASVVLLEHTGEVKWGPVAIPGGGGGALTVSDVDGDGEVEISVAGARNYVVFETDGSIKWQNDTQDYSSGATGSTVFDFEGDGKAEILYNDELKFRIYDGSTGDVLFDMNNSTGTLWEYPLVADIDNDDHAEIIVASNDYYLKPNTGILALENREDKWAPTRDIWNQHSYHINNVNDDGSIPVDETPSWLSHNSYRLNTFAEGSAVAFSDLSVSLLRLIDNGNTNPYTLKVRVGNGGIISSPTSTVSFYDGDPATGGQLIATQSISAIAANTYEDIILENVTGLSGANLYAIIDEDNKISECREDNNIVSVSFVVSNALGSIIASISEPNLYANSDTLLGANIINKGTFPADFNVELVLKDTLGNSVIRFPSQATGSLDASANVQVNENWNTGSTIAGIYTLEVTLRDINENIIDTDTKSLTIASSSGGITPTITASLRTTTDKPVYHTTDTLVIENLIQNLAVNNIIEDAVLKIDLMDPSGTQIYTQNITLGSLLPSAMRQSPLTLPFVSALEGIYTIKGTLLGKSGSSLASTSTTCEVKENLSQALLGEVSAQFDLIERGTQQVCRASVVHNGKVNISNLNLRQLLVSADTEAEVGNKAAITNLDAGQTYSFTYDFATQSMVEGEYLCILQAQINGTWETLAHDTYTLVRPPIEIDSLMQTGSHGPLLVLLDSPVEYGWCLGIFATGFHGHDPYGPKDAPLLVEQRAYLENLLDAHGYNYTIVDSEADFKRELRSGNYSTYALFNEYINMSSQTLSEIREAVYRGDGLLFAGKHQYCNDELEKPLGLDFRNTHDHVTNMTMIDTAEYSPSDISLAFEDKATRFRLKGAEALGSFEIKSSFFNFCPDDEKYSLTRNKYKNGRGVFAAFDLLMQAATPGAPAEVERILLEALDDIQPDVYNASIGSVYPIHMNMVNKQIATQGYTETRITGASVLDAGKGVFDTNTSLLNWRFTLSEDGTDSLDYWIKIPNGSAHVDIETSIYTGETGLENFYESITHTIAVDTSTYFSLQDALDASNAVGSWSLNTTEYHIKKAIYDEGQGDYSRALSHAIDAADCLAGMTSPEADVIRGKLAQAIRALSAKI